MRLGIGDVAHDFGISRNHDLSMGEQVHSGLGFDFVARLALLRINRLRQFGWNDCACRNLIRGACLISSRLSRALGRSGASLWRSRILRQAKRGNPSNCYQ